MPKAKSSKNPPLRHKEEVVFETAPAAPATQAVAPATPALQNNLQHYWLS